jgi:pimeloyl-ACP methyl ester carboxylesterase
VAGTLDSHVKDLSDLIQNFDRPPVVVAHSFGGLILQK